MTFSIFLVACAGCAKFDEGDVAESATDSGPVDAPERADALLLCSLWTTSHTYFDPCQIPPPLPGPLLLDARGEYTDIATRFSLLD